MRRVRRTRTRRAKRKSGRRTKSRVAGSASARDLAVMANPFYPNRLPKIPDGSAPESHGRQFKFTTTIAASGADRTVDLVLFPGLGGGMAWYNQTDASFNPKAGSSGYVTNTTHGQFSGITVPTASGPATHVYTMQDRISKWRMVSSGVRFKDLTADQTVKGWFEAITINKQLNDSDLMVVKSSAGATAVGTQITDAICMPNLGAFKNIVLANDPSYQTGSFRDINSMVFALKRADNEGSFALPPFSSGFSANWPDVTSGYCNVTSGATSPNELSRSLIDPQWQYTLIRLYMPSSARLMVEYVSNQELIYDEASTLNTFMTRSNKDPRVETVSMRRDMQAVGTKRLGTAGIYGNFKRRRLGG